MGAIGTLIQFVAGTKAKAAEVNANFAVVKASVNSVDSTQIANSALLTATTHGDLSGSTATLHSAASSTFSDATFTATNVSTAIKELGVFVGKGTATTGSVLKRSGSSWSATIGSVSVVVPANTATTGVRITFIIQAAERSWI